MYYCYYGLFNLTAAAAAAAGGILILDWDLLAA
jgi:hypothetical protein